MEKLKIFATGDFHGNTLTSEKFAKKAEEVNADLVVICGDMCHGQQEVDGLLYPFIKRNQKVLFVPGNHDSFAFADFLHERYGKKADNIHGRYYVTGKGDNEVAFFGVGGANVGMEALTEDEIFQYLQQSFDKIKDVKTKILVAHVHPAGTKMANMSKFVAPSTGIQKAIEKFKPQFMLCCHLHEGHGLEEKLGDTRVINVGRGKTIDIGDEKNK